MAADARVRRLPTGLIAGAVFIAALLVLLVLFRSGERGAPEVSRDIDVTGFEEHVTERLDPVDPEPVRVLRVRARRLAWSDGSGRPWLQATVVTFTVRVGAALGGEVVIEGGVVQQPEVHLVQSPAGDWNYERVLDPILDGGARRRGEAGNGAAMRVVLRDVALRDGLVTVQLPDTRVTATAVEVRLARAELSGPGVAAPTFQIASAEAMLDLPEGEGRVTRRLAMEEARLRLADGALRFEVGAGAFGESTFADAAGVWDPGLGGLGFDATVTVTHVELADLPWIRTEEVPEGAEGAFRLALEPLPGDRTALAFTAVSVRAPGSSATGSVRAILGGAGFTLESVDLRVDPLSLDLVESFTGPLPYTGTLTGRIQGTGGEIGFELRARLATSPVSEPFTTDLTGSLAFTDAGARLRGLTAQLDQVPLEALQAIAPGLPLRGPVSGSVTLTGAPDEAPIRLDIRLEAGGGVVTLAGMLDLTGAEPAYDLTGRLVGVELQEVLQPAAPPAQVHAAFRLQGYGTDPATANASVVANGTFTGWRSEPGDTLAIRAQVDDGLLRAEAARVELGPVRAAASGTWRFANGTGGSIAYDLVVESLEPLAPYLPPDQGRRRFAQGSLQAEGSLSGTLDRPVLAGRVEAADFRYGEWAAEAFSGTYDIRADGGLPYIEAEFAGREIRTPSGDFDTARLDVDFTRPEFELAFQADQEGGGGLLEVEAEGRIEEAGGREILVRRMDVDLADQRWRLPGSARIAWTTGEAVRVEDLRLEQVETDGLIRMDGIVFPFEQADFEVEVRRLPAGELLELIGSEVPLAGRLSMTATVTGPAETPDVRLRAVLAEGSVRGVAVSGMEIEATYDAGSLILEGDGLLGDSARVAVSGRLPVRLALGLPPTVELIDDGAIDLRLLSERLPLATLDPGIRSVENLEGRLQADIRLGGTPANPRLSGEAHLDSGAVTVPLVSQRYTGITGDAVLEGRELRLRGLTVESGGTARVTGVMSFETLTDPTLDLTAELEEFRPQGVDDEEDAAVWGTVAIGGTIQRPVVSGSVRAGDGAFSIAAFQGPRFDDQLVGIAPSFDVIEPSELDLTEADQGGIIVRDLQVRALDDLWFTTDEARAQLAGDLTVNRSGGDLMIQGTLSGQRGTFTLKMGEVITRRFEIISANIRFYGSPTPNPGLDITATRLVRAGQNDLEVRAQVSGTLNNPVLSLATAEGTSIPESDLLSFLIFGRATNDLADLTGGGGLGTLTELGGLAGVSDLLSNVAADLVGADYLQLTVGPEGLLGANYYVTAGWELSDEVFLLAEAPPGGFNDLWALELQWRIDREWSLEGGFAPVDRYELLQGTRSIPLQQDESRQQLFIVIRRRWTY